MSSVNSAAGQHHVSFTADGYELQGVLHLPAVSRPPVVIGSHGLFSDGDSRKQIDLANICNRYGIAYFRFHHRGCGISQGDFQTVTSLDGRCRDLLAAIETVRAMPVIGEGLGIFGSSMGGATAIAAAAQMNAPPLVTLAAPVRSAPVLAAARNADELRGLPLSFYERQLSFDLSPLLGKISTVLVVHGGRDDVVPVENAEEVYRHATDPKQLLILANGDHRVTAPHHQAEFLEAAVRWYRRWLPARAVAF